MTLGAIKNRATRIWPPNALCQELAAAQLGLALDSRLLALMDKDNLSGIFAGTDHLDRMIENAQKRKKRN
jgi:hypothetical protein